MNNFAKVGVASVLVIAAFGGVAPASAGGLSMPSWGGGAPYKGGSYDTFKGAPAPVAAPVAYAAPTQRNCYWRLDAGASLAEDPKGTFFFEDQLNPAIYNKTTNEDMSNGAVFDAGVGCGFSNGFRSDVVFSWRTKKDIHSDPLPADPLWSDVTSHTLMANIYYDFNLGMGITPYIGAGLGMAYHDMSDTRWVDDNGFTRFIRGGEDVNIAWSLMAGAAYEVSPGVTLDVGYRYIDMGDIASERHVVNQVQLDAEVDYDDLRAHEIKAGVRVSLHRAVAAMVPFK